MMNRRKYFFKGKTPKRRNKNKENSSSRRRKRFDQLQHYPKYLHGPATNQYGGNSLQRLRGLRGGTYGPAGKCVTFTKEQIKRWEERNKAKADASNDKAMPLKLRRD